MEKIFPGIDQGGVELHDFALECLEIRMVGVDPTGTKVLKHLAVCGRRFEPFVIQAPHACKGGVGKLNVGIGAENNDPRAQALQHLTMGHHVP